MDVLGVIIKHLAPEPGVRILVMVSPGFPTPEMDRNKNAVIDAAVRARIVVNTLDSEGLVAGLDAKGVGMRQELLTLMSRAQAVGSSVLVLTIDLAVVGARHRDVRNAVVGEPPVLAKVVRGLDLVAHPRWFRDVALGGRPLTFGNLENAVPGARSPAAFRDWVDGQFDPSVTWDDIAWVRKNWSGRLVVKGVLDPEDARRAADVGVDGVIVSNHGGRQLDSVPSTARALPDVADAVGNRLEVLVDGGIRSGLDVVKMVALGARAVLIGRAWAWAVAARGEEGVRHILEVIKADIDVALGLTGHTSLAGIDRAALYQAVGSPVPSG